MPSIWITTQEFNKKLRTEKVKVIMDNRTKVTRDTYRGLFLIIGIFVGALSIKWGLWEANQLAWADSQVPMLLSPIVVHAQEVKPTPTPDPKELIIAEIREVFGKDADDAIKVARCESGLRADAVNKSNSNGSRDGGLFQINSIHGIPDRYLFNSSINIRVAKQLFDEQGWNPWKSSNHCHHMLG